MKNILVAVDFSEITPSLIQQATKLAKCYQAKLWLIHVAAPDPDFVGYEAGPQTVRDARAKWLRKEHQQLQKYANDLLAQGVEAAALLIQGSTSASILEQTEKVQAELIILGSHGHGLLYHALIGSVCEGVLRRAKVPLLIVPASNEKD